MKKLLSLLLVIVMLASLGLTAFAAPPTSAEAEAPAIEAVVTELNVAGNAVYVYAPKSELTVASTFTGPAFMVFGAAPYTAESAKAEAEESGLGALAAAEGTNIVFINPQGEGWGEADLGVYSGLIDMYSNSAESVYVNGIAEAVDFLTGGTATKIQGDTARVYIYGIGPGADFVAANLMKNVVASVTYPDGFTMTFDRTPTTVTLIAPSVIPAATEAADIAVAVIEGPADAAEKLATLTDKVLISDEEIDVVYKKLSGAWRRQVGVMIPMHDYEAECIEVVEAHYTLSSGRPIDYVVYYGTELNVAAGADPVPLMLTFNGGGGTALGQALQSDWPQVGKAHGFMTVSVDRQETFEPSDIIELLDYLKTVYAIDASRVYGSGFSMGSVKSWGLFEQYPTLFAGLAPMSGSFESPTGEPADVITPVFYVGGQASPLPELCNQGPNIPARVEYVFKANKIGAYTYDAEVNLWWGVNGDITYQVTDKVTFTDSTLNVNLFKSADGRYYTALADATNQSHEVYARNSWAAWDFLKQFSRNADGSIVIESANYTLASDDGKVVDNSYNTVKLPEPDVTTYTVVKGDTLWGIAYRLLGSGYKWTAIYNANSSVIADPNLIYVGQVLEIPSAK